MGDTYDVILDAGPEYSIWYGGGASTDTRSTYYRMATWGEGMENDTDADTDAGIAEWGTLDISRPSSQNVGPSMAWGGWFLVEKLQAGNIYLYIAPSLSVYESD